MILVFGLLTLYVIFMIAIVKIVAVNDLPGNTPSVDTETTARYIYDRATKKVERVNNE